MWETDVLWFETTVVLGIFAVGSILFGHVEEHKPKWRRLLKVVIVLVVVLTLSATVGRAAALGLLAIPMLAGLVVHAWWLPRHPRELCPASHSCTSGAAPRGTSRAVP